jgi:hypothetical protein
MAEQKALTVDQAVRAQRALRESLGLADETFPLPAFIGMISDEIQQMREAGRSDTQMIDIIAKATGTRLDPADLQRFYVPPEHRRQPH